MKVKKQDDLQKLRPKESVSFKEYKKELDKGSRIGAHKIFVATIKNGSPELRRLYCKEQIKLLNSY